MSSPLISVIIPVYNTEKYLRRCLDSIVSQNFQDMEIVCIDDCSSDSSFSILDEYQKKDNRFTIFKNEANQGAGYTKNFAMKKASGRYVCFVDSDDWIVEGALNLLYETAVKNEVDDVFFLLYDMNESQGKLLSSASSWRKFEDGHIYEGLEFLNALLDEKKLTTAAVHHFVKRECALGYASFSEKSMIDDMTFSCNLMANVRSVLFLKKELYVYFHRNKGCVTGLAKNTEYAVRYANESCFFGIDLYHSLCSINSDLAKSVARKLLKSSFRDAEYIAFNAGNADRKDFLPNIITEARHEYRYVSISQNTMSELAGDIYIYGTGGYAIDIYRQLIKNEKTIMGFIVTKAEKTEFGGKPVFGISDFPVPENATLIIGTSEKFYDEILAEPKVKQFFQIMLAKDL